MITEELAAIEARLAAATEGPWIYRDIIGGYHNVTRNAWDVASCGAGDLDPEDGDRDEQAARNAEFIAHAREDVPALLAAVRERDNTIARIREVLDDYDGLNAEPIPKLSTHTWMHEVRAALDPQETP